MADGTQMAVAHDDRLKLPSWHGSLVVIGNIYKFHSERTKYHYADIDSMKVWHLASPGEE